MAILRFSEEPVAVVFREGISGTKSVSQQFGTEEWQHFVNQYRGDKDTIYLPKAAQRILETVNPSNSEAVLISKEKLRGKWEWRIVIDEEQAAQTKRRESQAASRPAANATQTRAQNLLDHSSREHALNYPQQPAHRPEANMMAGALLTAIEATKIAEDKSGVKFSTDDIRAFAISMYIEACKQRAEAGRRAA